MPQDSPVVRIVKASPRGDTAMRWSILGGQLSSVVGDGKREWKRGRRNIAVYKTSATITVNLNNGYLYISRNRIKVGILTSPVSPCVSFINSSNLSRFRWQLFYNDLHNSLNILFYFYTGLCWYYLYATCWVLKSERCGF